MSSSRRPMAMLPAIAAIVVASVYAYNVARWQFLGDDAFISFRYAKNLVEGHGLVWNPGERVEGYTNFLWVLLLAAGMRLGLAPEPWSQVLGVAAGALVLVLVVAHGRRRHGETDFLVWLPALLLAANRSFAAWSTGGLETQLFAAFVLAGCLELVREHGRGEPRPWRSATAFALATLTRPEGALFAAVAGACLLWTIVVGRRRRWSALGWWLLPYVAAVGGHVAWRLAYYGSLVPNTFHAKVNGLWWEQGLRYLGLFAGDYAIAYLAPLLLLPLLVRRDLESALLSAATVAHLAYVAAVGGDRFEFRFIVFVLPLLYLLLADGLRIVAELRAAGRAGPVLVAIIALAALAVTHLGSVRPAARELRDGVNSIERMKRYAARRSEEGKALRALVDRGLLPDDLRIAVGGAGALPYYSELPTLDYFGLNDAQVARGRVAERSVVGHEHRASVAYMRERGVVAFDILNQMLYRASPRYLEDVRERLASMLGATEARPGEPALSGVCMGVEAETYLVFATPLTVDEVVARLPALTPCPPQGPR